ncbi:MAG: carboxypeptidase-like regulatory domain-containing protein [Planctomycetota bacterium]
MRRSSGQWMVLLGFAFMAAAVLVLYFGEEEEPRTAGGAEVPEAAVPAEGRQPEGEEGPADATQGEAEILAPKREKIEEEPWQNESLIVAVSGQVRDRSGKPLAGVVVSIVRPNPRGVGGKVLTHCLTDERGNYSLNVTREGGLVIDAYDDLHHRSRIKMLKNGGEEHDFELEPVESS